MTCKSQTELILTTQRVLPGHNVSEIAVVFIQVYVRAVSELENGGNNVRDARTYLALHVHRNETMLLATDTNALHPLPVDLRQRGGDRLHATLRTCNLRLVSARFSAPSVAITIKTV